MILVSLVYKSFWMFFEKPSRPFRQINLRNTVEVWFFGYMGSFFSYAIKYPHLVGASCLCSLVFPLILKVLRRFRKTPSSVFAKTPRGRCGDLVLFIYRVFQYWSAKRNWVIGITDLRRFCQRTPVRK